MGKYRDVIGKSNQRKEEISAPKAEPTVHTENQINIKPENQINGKIEKTEGKEQKEQMVNLTLKIPLRLRKHFVIEAKRRDTTLTKVILDYLIDHFGEPEEGEG